VLYTGMPELAIGYKFSFITTRTWLFRTDSGLDAFSLYLTDGSFTALPSQATVLTNYLILLFLSY
jgi:hypothetical protein